MPTPPIHRLPARVLGCLRKGELTVIILPGSGMANGGVVRHLPMQTVPFYLRMPNSEFDVLFDPKSGFIRVDL